MSLKEFVELLDRQKLVEGMVHSQQAPHQDLVETLVQRQHLTEVRGVIERSPAPEIASVLETLSPERAAEIWQQIPQERVDEILWELSDEARQRLVGSREADFGEGHTSAHELQEGRLRQVAIKSRKDLESVRPIWVDLLGASKIERLQVERHFGFDLPDPSDSNDLEVSVRFRVEDDEVVYLQSNFLLDRGGRYRSVPVAFVLRKGVLFSVRDQELPVFKSQKGRAGSQPGYVSDCIDVLLDLYGADVESSADAMEAIYASLGQVGSQVLREVMTDTEAAAILADIAEQEDLNGRIRSNILDTHRALSFLMRRRLLSPGQVEDARQIMRDIESLNSHTSFVFDKINFLMDATVGFININQNKRVNQLTALGVVFMPINVLAGIGGMSEFSMMTKSVPWPAAYGGFIAVMGMVGWGTYQVVRYFESRRIVKKTHDRTLPGPS
jgi:magnesium transporter